MELDFELTRCFWRASFKKRQAVEKTVDRFAMRFSAEGFVDRSHNNKKENGDV